MSLTFYYAPMSTATITELVIEELGTPCEKISVDFKKQDTHTPEFLRLNPNGKVPLIIHDGMPIWESAAITMYLGEIFGVDKGLYPPPGPQRGELMKWIVWANVSLGEATLRWLLHTSDQVPQGQRNAQAAEAAKAEMHKCLAILNESLQGRQYLGDTYSVADTHLNSFTDWLRFMKVPFSDYPHLNAWGERCRMRPAYARIMAASMGQ